jgi:hypothetical protein
LRNHPNLDTDGQNRPDKRFHREAAKDVDGLSEHGFGLFKRPNSDQALGRKPQTVGLMNWIESDELNTFK